MRYTVEIETRPMRCFCCGQYRRDKFESVSVSGPNWTRRWTGHGDTAVAAFTDTTAAIQTQYPQHSFDFVHTPA